jgi:hypothetical protein
MRRRAKIAVVLGIACATLNSVSPSSADRQQSSSQTTDLGARGHGPYRESARRPPPHEPHYYARPTYYRPYSYRAPYPFVFGFGPW